MFFQFQGGGLVQDIGEGDQMLTLIIAVICIFSRAVLEALDLCQRVPPQEFRFVAECVGLSKRRE